MQAQSFVSLAGAGDHRHVVALLKADAIAVIIMHSAMLHDGAGTSIEKDASAAATVQIDILLLVAFDHQILDSRAFDMIAADHWKDRRGLRAIIHHAVGIQGEADGEGVSAAARDPGDCRMEATTGVLVPN